MFDCFRVTRFDFNVILIDWALAPLFNRSVHSAGPGEWGRIKGKEGQGRGKKEYGGGGRANARRMREQT